MVPSPLELTKPDSLRERRVDAALASLSAAIIGYGVLALEWSVFIVMGLFWFENVVIGGFNVLRMLVSGARLGGAGMAGALFMAAFFTVHYGLFTAVHGVFVVMLFGGELGREAMQGGLTESLLRMLGRLFSHDGWIAVVAIVTAHAVAFVQWLTASRDAPPSVRELMFAPYGRIVVLHVTLIAGGFLVTVLKAPVLGVVLLVGLKLAYDLRTLWRPPAEPGLQSSSVIGRSEP